MIRHHKIMLWNYQRFGLKFPLKLDSDFVPEVFQKFILWILIINSQFTEVSDFSEPYRIENEKSNFPEGQLVSLTRLVTLRKNRLFDFDSKLLRKSEFSVNRVGEITLIRTRNSFEFWEKIWIQPCSWWVDFGFLPDINRKNDFLSARGIDGFFGFLQIISSRKFGPKFLKSRTTSIRAKTSFNLAG